MVSFGKHRAASTGNSIDGAGQPHGQPLHAPRQARSVVGFDGRVKVVPLEGPIDDTELVVASLAHRNEHLTDGSKVLLSTYVMHIPERAESHVDRVVSRERWSCTVRYSAAAAAQSPAA